VTDKLVSWTVEADDDQVTQLSRHAGITRVARLDLNHSILTSTTSSDISRAWRGDPMKCSTGS
jgi:hypothetical protein